LTNTGKKYKFLYGEIIKYTNLHYKDLIHKLKNTYHYSNYDDSLWTKSLPEDKANRYHLENDVWTHTMMVYNNSCLVYEEYDKLEAVLCKAFTTLLHDFGKMDTRKEIEDNKVRFIGHGNASTQYVFEIVPKILFIIYEKYLKEDETLTTSDYRTILDSILYKIAFVVSRHDDFYNHITEKDLEYIKNNDDESYEATNKIEKFCNGDTDIVSIMNNLVYCDCNGQLQGKDISETLFSSITDFGTILTNSTKQLKNNEHDYVVTLLSGVPGSGKNYYLDNILKTKYDNVIDISFDDLRIEYYRSILAKPADGTDKELYDNAYHYCNNNNIDLAALSLKKMNEYKDNKKFHFVINNTNITQKSRKKMINMISNNFKDKNIIFNSVFIGCDLQTCLKRNNLPSRTHNIPEHAIKFMSHKTSIPSMSEGFDTLEFVWNH